jgi:hypothetical protein
MQIDLVRSAGATPVLRMTLTLPLNGGWDATVEVAPDRVNAGQTDAIEANLRPYAFNSPVYLRFTEDSGSTPPVVYAARVVRAGVNGERIHLRLSPFILTQTLSVKHYTSTTFERVLADAGLSLEGRVGGQLDHWTRLPGTVGTTVQTVADFLSRDGGIVAQQDRRYRGRLNWRFSLDGKLRLNVERPRLVSPGGIELERDPARGYVVAAPERAVIAPGCLVQGSAPGEPEATGDVIYEYGPEKLRCLYYIATVATATAAQVQTPGAQVRGAFERAVRWVMRDTLYLGQYTARVITQRSDGTLDLIPDDNRLASRGLQGVPIRHGLPGVTVEVPSEARVLLGFDSGDPNKPYAALWHEGQVTSVNIGGTRAVAMADLVLDSLTVLKQAITSAAATESGASGLGGMSALSTALGAQWPGDEPASTKLFTD